MWVVIVIFAILTLLTGIVIGGPSAPDPLYDDPVVVHTRHEFQDGYELGRSHEANKGFKFRPDFSGRSQAWVEGFQAGQLDESKGEYDWAWTSWVNSKAKSAVYQDRQAASKGSPVMAAGGA